ncbi:Dyp-type peroxidase [Hafnia paralvei]|uniref:Dyp-type peroxidase n=1 Tax=Hafnia paralvei TaxID=546367 RepID=A0A4Q9ET59_9GAMM|nr:Dyp-type peroxidase [Hafnia paralvei]TBM29300.1 Dyp-type peroxidase [Hafnia paralvei]
MSHFDVTNGPGENAFFLVFNLMDTVETQNTLIDFCSEFSAISRSMRNRFPELEISCVMGFGAQAWRKYFPEQPVPKELFPFEEIKGQKHTAVSTPGDIFFHIRALRVDACYEMASIICKKLSEITTVVDEVHGFRYFDGRSIIGFVDGTENPEYPDERIECAVIGDEDLNFRGGSYAFVQKYIHDMKAWENLPTEMQEKVIGRHKFNDVELSDEEKNENTHNVVTNIQDDQGNDLKIVRANMPFSNPAKGEYGTYFIGYSRYFSTTKRMLENMFIGDPIGNSDKLLDFSVAVTGTLFFIPSPDLLERLGD